MQKRTVLIGVLAVLGAGAWYAFRPERLFVNQKVSESLGDVAATNATVATGQFHGVHHDTKGTASIIRVGGGKQVLRLTGFETSNGPDVRVYLVAAPDANDNATVTTAGFVEVGALKGNIGDQNYDVPASVDLSKYRTVTIWCRRFGVNFGSAPLAAM
ncbi:MAG: DM13 domain-containing protein [Gemmatimonadaceae bacterium]